MQRSGTGRGGTSATRPAGGRAGRRAGAATRAQHAPAALSFVAVRESRASAAAVVPPLSFPRRTFLARALRSCSSESITRSSRYLLSVHLGRSLASSMAWGRTCRIAARATRARTSGQRAVGGSGGVMQIGACATAAVGARLREAVASWAAAAAMQQGAGGECAHLDGLALALLAGADEAVGAEVVRGGAVAALVEEPADLCEGKARAPARWPREKSPRARCTSERVCDEQQAGLGGLRTWCTHASHTSHCTHGSSTSSSFLRLMSSVFLTVWSCKHGASTMQARIPRAAVELTPGRRAASAFGGGMRG